MSSLGYNGNSGHDERLWAHPNQLEHDVGNNTFDQDNQETGFPARGFQISNIDPNLLRQTASSPISAVPNTTFTPAFDTGLVFPPPSTEIAAAGDEPWIPESYEIDSAAAPAINNWLHQNFPGAESQSIGHLPIQQTAYISAAPMPSQYPYPQTAGYAPAPTAKMGSPFGPYANMDGSAAPQLYTPVAGSSTARRPNKRPRVASPAPNSFTSRETRCLGYRDPNNGNIKTCTNNVAKADPDGLRCKKCYTGHTRVNAQPKQYTISPAIGLAQAWDALYPLMPSLAHPQDDVHTERFREQEYMQRLGQAVSMPYLDDGTNSKANSQRLRQQVKMNRKPFDSPQYETDLVNKRLLLLFHTAVSYHAGGPSYYDIGGDNYGYGEDKDLIFSQRLDDIINMLTSDKDVAMDVIEGRGVTALVKNPDKYQRRKRDNKKSNDTKADLQEKGKAVVEAEKGRGSSAPEMGMSGGGGDRFGFEE